MRKIITSVVLLLCIMPTRVFAAEQPGREITIGTMKHSSAESVRKIISLRDDVVQKMTAAEKKRDLTLKICLEDVLAAVRGLVASARAAQSRMTDLAAAGRTDAARTQYAIVLGIFESSQKLRTEAYACEGSAGGFAAGVNITVERSEDLDESVNGSLGVGFSDDMLASSDKSNLGEIDHADAGGSDEIGGPLESPEESGGDASSQEDAVVITDPEIVDVSQTAR